MIYCGKSEFGHIFRSFSSNSGAILLKRSKNLTQIGFPSLRPVKSDRLLVDDMVDSRWTLTVAAFLLTTSGSGPVYPSAMASNANCD
jgi:phosphoribosylpyrophosphate synthetase